MRGASVLLASCLCACTAVNPDYLGSTACIEGQRGCVGSRPVACGSDRALRSAACQSGAACADGRCVAPASAAPCFSDKDCMGGRVCTALVDSTRPAVISTFCLPPEGITDGAEACRGAQECRSGLCVGSGAQPVCLRACQRDSDCSAGTRCQNFDVEITGVRGTIHGCEPA